MAFPADPGGVFASDVHRRVLAHLTEEAMSLPALEARISTDQFTYLRPDDLETVLGELKDEGYANQLADGGWKQTKAGLNALTGPNAGDESEG